MTGLQISMLALVGAMMLFFFFGTVVVVDKLTANQQIVDRRVGLIVDRKSQEKKKKKKGEKTDSNKGFAARQSIVQKIEDALLDELLAADIMMKPEEFAILWIVVAFVPALLAMVLSRNQLLPLVIVVVGVVAPVVYIKYKQGKRVKAFEGQLSDALLICCNCLRAGLTFNQAMENIAEEMDAPIGPEFKRVVNEINFGNNMEEALNNMAERINSPDLTLTVAAVSIQRQTGGNLSEILEVISTTIRDRTRIKKEISSITAQGRMSGLIIGLLPIFIAMALMVINPDYIMTFITTKAGNIMLVICVLMECIGFFAINKVVEVKY